MQAGYDRGAVSRQLPQQARTIVFDHQHNGPLIKPEVPRRYPPSVRIAGFSRVGWIKGRFETVGIELC